MNNHQTMCKILSGKKYLGVQKHETKSCKYCNDSLDYLLKAKTCTSIPPCIHESTQCYLLNQYWLHFGYHKEALCNCTLQDKIRRVKKSLFPMQAPFTLGELSGEYQGWIDQYLALLSTYIITLEQKYEKEISMLDIRSNITEVAMFIAGSRASYWYLCTNEKVRAMSEVLFTQRMLTKTTDTRYVNNGVNHI